MRSITISFFRHVTLDVFSQSDRYQQDEQTLLLRLLPNRTRIRFTTNSKVELFVVRSSVATRTIARLYLRPDGAWMFVPTTLKVRPGPSVGFYAENMYLKRCSRSVGALDYRPEWPSRHQNMVSVNVVFVRRKFVRSTYGNQSRVSLLYE